MANFAENTMLTAALEDDAATLTRLAEESSPSERRNLARALDRVYDALVAAERQEIERKSAETMSPTGDS